MNNFLLNTKKVLSICMETTAGGRNYSGGLGALYGDTTRTMDRLGASFIAVTPIYKNGYVQQWVNDDGVIDEYPEQNFDDNYEDTGISFNVPMLNREIKVKVWKHKTLNNAYGLDSVLPENGEYAYITRNLYGENGFFIYDGEAQRLMQEVIVGVGAIKLAKEIGFDFDVLHLNEGHGVFAALYMISELKKTGLSFEEAWKAVKQKTVFTTHTPIAAGNKSRPIQMILNFNVNFGLSFEELKTLGDNGSGIDFGSTSAALRVSRLANAVAFRHQFTSHDLWNNVNDGCRIISIDNGVDIVHWQDPAIRKAYDNFDNEALLNAHNINKLHLINEIEKRNGVRLDPKSIIIGFARRVIQYKRADMIFEDINRFENLIKMHNIQIVFSGKTHPKDWESKQILKRLYEMTKLYPQNIVFIQNYDVEVARIMTRGVDVWMGYPQIPLEACSTSGMKAAANGVPNLSTPDGWWYKSVRDGVNGWKIGEYESKDKWTDAQYLYAKLKDEVMPAFHDKKRWVNIMRSAIYTALEEYSTERMARDYYQFLYN